LPPILFLYGLAGSGKSFAGDLLGRMTGVSVYHADIDLTAEMRSAVSEGRPFTEEMRDRYFGIVIERIKRQRELHPHLVVTQAVYKRKHRDYIRQSLPEVRFVCVQASDDVRIQRLIDRGDQITPEYDAVIRVNFEPPAEGDEILWNEGDEAALAAELGRLLRP
jgi:gluconate kinase